MFDPKNKHIASLRIKETESVEMMRFAREILKNHVGVDDDSL
jgi:hypothetical protein